MCCCCDDWGWECPKSPHPWLLPHLDVFLQLAQSCANLHWSACLCAILASSSSQIWTQNIESLATSSLQFGHTLKRIFLHSFIPAIFNTDTHAHAQHYKWNYIFLTKAQNVWVASTSSINIHSKWFELFELFKLNLNIIWLGSWTKLTSEPV